MLDRRQFLALGATTAVAGALHRTALAQPAAQASLPHAPVRPRTFVQIILRGGFDPILATDPKDPEQVARDIDVPYRDREVVERRGRRFGPVLRPLGALLDDLVVVRGIKIYTVSHPAAMRRLLELRNEVARNDRLTPGFTGVLDGQLPWRPIGCLRQLGGIEAGIGAARDLSVRYEQIGTLERLRRLAKTGERCPQDPRLDTLLQHLAAANEPVKVTTPRLPAVIGRNSAEDTTQTWSRYLADLFFVLENDLANTVLLYAPFPYWDSHQANRAIQHGCWAVFAPILATILGELRERKSPRGCPLADEVGLLVSSEIGRFPRLNSYAAGKDHFPEISCLLSGPGLNRTAIGATNERMAGTMIADGGTRRFLELDDLGASILQWFGVTDRERLGYLGRGVPGLLAG
ncbi:MAG TPA: hypothetical protein VF516_14940 [Kofleriaceae bacterium]